MIENELKELKKELKSMRNDFDNMDLWEKVCNTDLKFTKKVQKRGFKILAITAQYQIKKATKIWGPFGLYWGIKDEKFQIIDTFCLYTAILYYVGDDHIRGEFPIHSDISLKMKDNYNEDWAKKVATDALTKGLSKLGFNSDVFEGKYDSETAYSENKYIADNYNNKKNYSVKDEIEKYLKKNIPDNIKKKIIAFLNENPSEAAMFSYLNNFLNKMEA